MAIVGSVATNRQPAARSSAEIYFLDPVEAGAMGSRNGTVF